MSGIGGLRFSSDTEPGLHRRQGDAGFQYVNERRHVMKSPAILARIKSLVIPPAWTDVWICRDANGHLQATGRDARGRKQYRYHPKYREQREAHKFDRMFEFRGKSGKFQKAVVDDPRLARIIRRCRELPGQALFEYLDDDGKPQAIGSSDVNDYLKEIAGVEISAKDFRTWAGTVLVANVLAKREGPVGPSHVVAAVRAASLRLGNTPAICRKSYVHPRVLDPKTWAARPRVVSKARTRGLRADESALLRLLGPLRERSRTRRLPTASHPT